MDLLRIYAYVLFSIPKKILFLYSFQGQDNDFKDIATEKLQYGKNGQKKKAALAKKDDFFDQNFGFVQLQKQKNLPRTVVSELGSCLNYATIALYISMLAHTPRLCHTVAATSSHLTAFRIKMVRNRQREK